MAEMGLKVTGLQQAQQRVVIAGQLTGRAITRVFEQRLTQAVTYAQTTFLSGGTTDTRLAERTGQVKRSFATAITPGEHIVVGRLGYINNPPPWIGIHEYGGTIRPKNAKALAIPLTEEARQAGSPRNVQGETFLQRSRAGNMIVFLKRGDGTIEPLYVLVSSVTLPARPALRPTVARFAPLILNDLRTAVGQALRGGA